MRNSARPRRGPASDCFARSRINQRKSSLLPQRKCLPGTAPGEVDVAGGEERRGEGLESRGFSASSPHSPGQKEATAGVMLYSSQSRSRSRSRATYYLRLSPAIKLGNEVGNAIILGTFSTSSRAWRGIHPLQH